MSPLLESLIVKPETLARFGIVKPPKPKLKVHILSHSADPQITQAAKEYAACFKDGQPPQGTLKAIAHKYGYPASSIASRHMRMRLP